MAEEIIGQITIEGDTAIIAFSKSTVSNIDDISAAARNVADFIDENQPKRVIFDFKGVKFFSSNVLGLLRETRSRVESYQGRVYISSINPQLHRVFKITNLDQIFKFFPDIESAIKAPISNS
jgi:anti-anti-sigma factor